MDANYYIDRLELRPHPEGGHYRELYRSEELLESKGRNLATSIYFLLHEGEVSHFHRLKSDEIWYYHTGGPTVVYTISNEGEFEIKELGPQIHLGQKLQIILPAGTWFASTPMEGANFTLFGCVVAPGFDFKDFELADRAELIAAFPELESVIRSFTK